MNFRDIFANNTPVMIAIRLANIESILFRIEKLMDKQIKSAKKTIDKKMDKLVKEDIKRDKKCDHDEKIAKKMKKKK